MGIVASRQEQATIQAGSRVNQLDQRELAGGRVNGRVRLGFAVDPARERTALVVHEHQPPLRAVRAFPMADGGALVHLHNLSGGVLGGDRLDVTVEVGPGARGQLTSTGATRLYRSLPDVPTALQHMAIKVGEDGLLEYVPDPLIPFADARYRQETRIELAGGAGLFYWEILAPGREARGELFAYDLLHLNLDIVAAGRTIALERTRIEPGLRSISSLARLGPYRHYATFYVCRVGWPETEWLRLEAQLAEIAQQLTIPNEIVWGVSTLAAHGLSIRVLSRSGRTITPGLLTFWRAAKRALYGQEAVPPRKVY